MKIETKFDIDQCVFYRYDGAFLYGRIESFRVDVNDNDVQCNVVYRLGGLVWIKEKDMWASMDDVLNTIREWLEGQKTKFEKGSKK